MEYFNILFYLKDFFCRENCFLFEKSNTLYIYSASELNLYFLQLIFSVCKFICIENSLNVRFLKLGK